MHINVFRITADRRAFSTRSILRILKPFKRNTILKREILKEGFRASRTTEGTVKSAENRISKAAVTGKVRFIGGIEHDRYRKTHKRERGRTQSEERKTTQSEGTILK